ncbi:hypothetical protein MRX96_052866 [Rhipicephalus microplus]
MGTALGPEGVRLRHPFARWFGRFVRRLNSDGTAATLHSGDRETLKLAVFGDADADRERENTNGIFSIKTVLERSTPA